MRPIASVVDVATGAIIQRLDYDAWGRVTQDTNPGFQPFGYAGCLHDQATRLVHMGAREYDPSLGRFTRKDPIDFAGGDTNLYAYVKSDSVNFADPSGLNAFGAALGWVAESAISVAFPPIGAYRAYRGVRTLVDLLGDAPVAYPSAEPTGAAWAAAGQAVAGAVIESLSPPDALCSDGDDANPADERAKRCHERYDKVDGDVCRAFARAGRRGDASRCWESAAARLAACLTGEPLPPLHGWN